MKAKPINAGDLDREVTRLKLSLISDAVGERAKTYDAMGTYPCRFIAGKGSEKEGELADVARATAEFTVRYGEEFTETDRLLFEGVTYQVVAIAEGENRRQWLHLTAQRTDVLNPAS